MDRIIETSALQAAIDLEDAYLDRVQYGTAALEVLKHIPFEQRAVIRLHYLRDYRKDELGLTNVEFNNIVRTLQTIAGTMHRCKRCKELKPADEFSATDGAGAPLKPTCKECYCPAKDKKTCKTCGLTKPASAYDKYRQRCRECISK